MVAMMDLTGAGSMTKSAIASWLAGKSILQLYAVISSAQAIGPDYRRKGRESQHRTGPESRSGLPTEQAQLLLQAGLLCADLHWARL